ncbi:carbonic anhydrase [Auriculariales sp. MPI-PUGE-AT-0066]|nr:carbonic anhydrase [Auriculariales sp. MPI-PUGE-AT-0066]
MPSSLQFPPLQRILVANAQWAQDVAQAEPHFFEESAQGQAPKLLWIGCADSRVPESVLGAARPGEIFVHRNIANQVHLDDDSVLSVITYAVLHLGVEHVVVAGHTNCGGAAAGLAASSKPAEAATTPLTRFIDPIVKIARSLGANATLNQLIDENVKLGVKNVATSEPIKQAWTQGKKVYVHGWVYSLESGTLTDLNVSVGPPAA